MPMVTGRCPLCDSEIRLDSTRENAFCSACGKQIEVKAALNNKIAAPKAEKESAPNETKQQIPASEQDETRQHTILASIGVGVLCALAYGWCCDVFNAVFLGIPTLNLIENLLGWAVGIAAGIIYRRNDDLAVPVAVVGASWIGLVVAWIHSIIIVVSNWGRMQEVHAWAENAAEQLDGLGALPYSFINLWTDGCINIAQINNFDSFVGNGLSGTLLIFLPWLFASCLAGLVPIGISYLCDAISGNHDLIN